MATILVYLKSPIQPGELYIPTHTLENDRIKRWSWPENVTPGTGTPILLDHAGLIGHSIDMGAPVYQIVPGTLIAIKVAEGDVRIAETAQPLLVTGPPKTFQIF